MHTEAWIKREARRQRNANESHSQVLERLSREAGFKTYAAFRAALKKEESK